MFCSCPANKYRSVSLPNTTCDAAPCRRSRYRSKRAASPEFESPRNPKSTRPVSSDDDAASAACCAPAVETASASAPTVINTMLRIALASYRRNAFPEGAFDPWICEWQTTQPRPKILLAFGEVLRTKPSYTVGGCRDVT